MPPRPSSGELWGIHLMPPRYDYLDSYTNPFVDIHINRLFRKKINIYVAEFWWTAYYPMGWFWPWSVSVKPHSIPSNMNCSRRLESILSSTFYRRRRPISLSVLHRWELRSTSRWLFLKDSLVCFWSIVTTRPFLNGTQKWFINVQTKTNV